MRAAGILVLCLISSILSTVTSLKCQECRALGTECEADKVKVVECKEDEEFCSTIVVNSSMSSAEIPVTVIFKKCSTREQCLNSVFSSTTVDGKFQLSRANCCQTDLCNAETLPLESYEDFKPNGLQCPGCFALDEDSCEGNQSVACVGKEDQCLTISCITVAELPLSGNFTLKFAQQGCTTKNVCSILEGYSNMNVGQVQINCTFLECRNASSSEPDHQ